MQRESYIRIRVSTEDKKRAKAIAAAEGMTMSEFLRRCIILAHPPEPTKKAA